MEVFGISGNPRFLLYPVLACKYGVIEAILISQFHYWSYTNKIRGENYHDGKYWVNKTNEEIAKEFGFCSPRTISRIIGKLKSDGIILVANYNRSPLDKSLWYTPNYEKLGEIFQNDNIGNDYSLLRESAIGTSKRSTFVPYQEYINSSKWKQQSKRRMAIDDFRCQRCGTAKNLVVHHITYERLGREEMDDLITLCKNCHKELHNKDVE